MKTLHKKGDYHVHKFDKMNAMTVIITDQLQACNGESGTKESEGNLQINKILHKILCLI
jgi:hypothetical protein